MTISVSLFHWHKTSQNVINCHKIRHKMSRQFATIYDIFCPVPFLPSPFGFRLAFRDIAEAPWLKTALAIAHPRTCIPLHSETVENAGTSERLHDKVLQGEPSPIQRARGFWKKKMLAAFEGPDREKPSLFWKKQGFFPKKARASLFAEPLKSLEKEGKTQEKARKISENGKSKEIEKSKDWRVRGLSGVLNRNLRQYSCDTPYFGKV